MIVFPDIQAVVIGELRDGLADHGVDVHVGSEIPNPRPDVFINVTRTGGTAQSIVTDAATLTIESWGPSPEVAHDNAQLCRAIVHALPPGTANVPIYRVDEFAGPAVLPDPLSEQPRVTFTISVWVRGTDQ